MKKFTEKVQRFGQRAAELKHAIASVPPKVVEIREAVAAATGQVQRLRADLASSVATLRAETDEQLVSTLREIDSAAGVLTEAGCHLAGVDLDLGPARKIKVHLQWRDEIDTRRVRALQHENASRPTVAALLSALLKADELSEQVELQHLRHAAITVEIGLVPSVRIGWRAEDETLAPVIPAPPAPGATESGAPPATLSPELMPGSFFARPETAPSSDAAPATAVATTPETLKPTSPAPAAGRPEEPGSKWRASALDRFKKMPDLARR